jgi:toxin ParE1/3/4
VTEYRLISEPSVDLDVEAAFEWYENEQAGLGVEFLDELRATYKRITDGPLKYQELRGAIRHALLKRFPYAVYFAVEGEIVIVVAVLHASRDPAEWQRRRG